MVSLARYFPLPFTCLQERYTAGDENAHGNATPGWAEPVPRSCVWWSPASHDPAQPPTGGERVIADLVLVVDVAGPVDHRDKFTIEGRRFEVIGIPEDYNHGPWGFSPDRLVVALKWVG
ncbi:hypothetical protein [Mycobacteroides sp. PCS013]|uniref:hypothetical protein n=1 Tax=Mycobacteroides sp. PCS013 TaxID=3074106 RepID=UPI003C2ED3DC